MTSKPRLLDIEINTTWKVLETFDSRCHLEPAHYCMFELPVLRVRFIDLWSIATLQTSIYFYPDCPFIPRKRVVSLLKTDQEPTFQISFTWCGARVDVISRDERSSRTAGVFPEVQPGSILTNYKPIFTCIGAVWVHFIRVQTQVSVRAWNLVTWSKGYRQSKRR